jgi:N-formylglutamate amidohydrolase
MQPVVLHIPHSREMIPVDLRSSYRVTESELERELLVMTDWHTEQIFTGALSDAASVVFPVSRLVVDPERFLSDEWEPMAKVGMGAVYVSRHNGTPLRNKPSDKERAALIGRFYDPHHEKLERVVATILTEAGRCLVLDCHSYPSVAFPYEGSRPQRRPEICLGTDPFHTPTEMSVAAVEALTRQGFEVACDEPFSGALVPTAFYRKDKRVCALMIELRRDIYMDEKTALLRPDASAFQARLAEALVQIVDAYNCLA